nr:uncharacterized protein LOC120975741 [Aegilops tauschii subsp. strangulata]
MRGSLLSSSVAVVSQMVAGVGRNPAGAGDPSLCSAPHRGKKKEAREETGQGAGPTCKPHRARPRPCQRGKWRRLRLKCAYAWVKRNPRSPFPFSESVFTLSFRFAGNARFDCLFVVDPLFASLDKRCSQSPSGVEFITAFVVPLTVVIPLRRVVLLFT